MRTFVAIVAALSLSVAAAARPGAGKASLSGVVLDSRSGVPLSNVRVTLARTDLPQGLFAQMSAGNPPHVETTIPARLLNDAIGDGLRLLRDGAIGPETQALVRSAIAACQSLPLEEIHEVVVRSGGAVAVVSKITPPAISDSRGRFTFDGVEPGAYRMMFSHEGYARQDYGQRGAKGVSMPIVLAANWVKTDADVVMGMSHTGAIAGRITDAARRPIVAVPVHAFRLAYDDTGYRKVQRVSSTRADDRGEYRIDGLSPGRYYVAAGHQVSVERPADPFPRNVAIFGFAGYQSVNRIAQQYALRFHPGVNDVNLASPIDIHADVDTEKVNLTVEPQRTYQIRGSAIDSTTGKPLSSARISLYAEMPLDPPDEFTSGWGPLAANVTTGRDGTFTIAGVAPGAYAVAGINPNVRIHVGKGDVGGVALKFGSGGTIAGKIRLTPDASRSFAMLGARFEFVQVHLLNVAGGLPPMSMTGREASVSREEGTRPDGSFRLPVMEAGEYTLHLRGLPSGFYVKEARFGGADVLNAPLWLADGNTHTLEITISPSSGRIDGVAVPGAQLILIPEGTFPRPDLFRPAVADLTGHFMISSIAPGEYRLAMWEAADPYAFFDLDFIRRGRERGIEVHVTESFEQTVGIAGLQALRIRAK